MGKKIHLKKEYFEKSLTSTLQTLPKTTHCASMFSFVCEIV